MKKTLSYLQTNKINKQKIIALTSYDYPTTVILEKTDVDMIILGDSVGTNVLGYLNETQVTLNDMIHHTKSVVRGLKNIFLVVDLPYKSYETPQNAVKNAKMLVDLGADAIKYEGLDINILKALKDNNITVMCHIGLNPQHDQEKMSKGRISKGKHFNEAIELIRGAQLLEENGADLIILEKIPERISKIITENSNIPTIGIGAGKFCNGQVLIIYDLLGINDRKFKHSPDYVDLQQIMIDTIIKYQKETREGSFPSEKHVNIMSDSEYKKIANWCFQNKFNM